MCRSIVDEAYVYVLGLSFRPISSFLFAQLNGGDRWCCLVNESEGVRVPTFNFLAMFLFVGVFRQYPLTPSYKAFWILEAM